MLGYQKKIVSLARLKKHLLRMRKQGKTIAFTNGCFDLLHKGHIHYLEKAKKGTRVLIVGLNNDVSVRKIKGPRRPIQPQDSRAAVLAALSCVDFVVLFKEETPYKLIRDIQPDVLIKGADYKGKVVVGSDIVRQRGGKVELVTYLPQASTTNIIERIKKRG